MIVIAEIQLSPDEFELGRILNVKEATAIELETVVPSGTATVPLFWAYEPIEDSFSETVGQHPTVSDLVEIQSFENQRLFRLDWDVSQDNLFQCLIAHDGQILSATGTSERWEFEVRFIDREQLSKYKECCSDANIAPEIIRIYNPMDPETEIWYELTEPQREAFALAVEEGYYDIPRSCKTEELADELDISDQAVTERLRRAINMFGQHAFRTSEPDEGK